MTDLIVSARNPLFRRLRKLDSDPHSRRREGLFLLWGARFVEEAMTQESGIVHLLLGEQRSRRPEIRPLLRLARQRDVPTTILSDALLNELAPGISDQGTLALARTRRESLGLLLERAVDPTLLVADRIQDPGNLGVLVRLAEAAGLTALVIVPGTVDPYHSRVARASAGSILRVPVSDLPRWPDWEGLVAKHRLRVVVTLPREGDDVQEADLRGPLALVVGNEGEGVADRWRESADCRATIQLGGNVESLNVTSAAAILLHERARQHRGG